MHARKALISYSHKDEGYRASLMSALANLVRNGALEIWSDHEILPGQHIDNQILSQLKEADVILLLVSPDFIASDYCFKKELQIALERHENGRAVVVPIVIRPTDWHAAPFAHLMMLPYDARPVSMWTNADEAWLDVAQGLRKLLNDIVPERNQHQVFQSKGIQSRLRDAFDQMHARYADPASSTSVSFGFSLSALDELTDGIWPGELAVIASRPDHGHVELAVSTIAQIAYEARKKTLVISQRSAAHQFTNRLICALGRISRSRFARSALDDDDWARVTSAIRILRNADITIDDDPIRSLAELREKLSQAADQKFEVVLIDGLEYLNAGSEERSLALRIADFARQFNVATIATITLGPEMELRALRKPLLVDLSAWRVLEDFSNKIVFCCREANFCWDTKASELSDECEVSLVKSPDGVTGAVVLKFFDDYGVINGVLPEIAAAKSELA